MTPKEILHQYWGYDDFRPLQADIIQSVLSGHDTLGLLPTGGGKSITFQVPALAMGGLTIVVTPLIALMKDQCDNLVKHGIRAAAVFMGMTQQQVLETYERVITADYRFLYLSPERLETRLFQAKLQYMDVRLLVVDEAHCISQWGYDFRPPYLRIAQLRQHLRDIRERNRQPWSYSGQLAQPLSQSPSDVYTCPCLALTATATLEVIDDIKQKLHFREGANMLRSSFVRPNLTYNVIHSEDKLSWLKRMLSGLEQQGQAAIVYVRSRELTAQVAEALCSMGIPAGFYHAGLDTTLKQQRQDAWMKGSPAVIVATNAFGMGIDKPNVRHVVHIDLPPSPEEYFQEAGRAGRDGKPAQATLIVCGNDIGKLRRSLTNQYPERDYIRNVYRLLGSYFQVAVSAGCNAVFEFELTKFCRAYRLAYTPAYFALKLLDQAGYISFIEEPDRHSRVMFVTSRESLYHLNQFDPECQRIIQALLRLYTGLFADFMPIREDQITQYTGLDRQVLYEKLLLLTRFHVLHYIPARQTPAIVYLTPRLEDDEIRISHTIYEERRARQARRVEAMIAYVNNNDECRLVQLLHYFSEDDVKPCGHCDVCISTERNGNVHEVTAMIRQLITDRLRARGPLGLQQLYALIEYEPDRVAEIVRTMVSDGDLILHDGILTLPQ